MVCQKAVGVLLITDKTVRIIHTDLSCENVNKTRILLTKSC